MIKLPGTDSALTSHSSSASSSSSSASTSSPKVESSKATVSKLPPQAINNILDFLKPAELIDITKNLKSREAVAAILKYDGNNQGEKDLHSKKELLSTLSAVSEEWEKTFNPMSADANAQIQNLETQRAIQLHWQVAEAYADIHRSLHNTLMSYAGGGVSHSDRHRRRHEAEDNARDMRPTTESPSALDTSSSVSAMSDRPSSLQTSSSVSAASESRSSLDTSSSVNPERLELTDAYAEIQRSLNESLRYFARGGHV